jgi:hypothetical protein
VKLVLCLLIGWFGYQLFIAIKERKIYLRNEVLHEHDNKRAFWRAVVIMAAWLLALFLVAGLLAYPPHFGP